MSNYSGSFRIQRLATTFYHYRVQPQKFLPRDHYRLTGVSSNISNGYSNLIRANCRVSAKSKTDHRVMIENKKPTVPGPIKPSFPSWVKWLLGSILSMVLPFWKQKWQHLLALEENAEKVIDEVEIVAEVVEKVAVATEKISSDVEDKIPNNGGLKEAALTVKHISGEVAKDAQLTQDIIHKVDELGHDLTGLESVVEPIIDKLMEKGNVEK